MNVSLGSGITPKQLRKINDFLYGVAYYAEGWPFIISGYNTEGYALKHPSRITKPEYLVDLENIKKIGLNTIRICEFSWSIFESKPDIYDFELYDRVLDKCAELGMYVILGVDTLNPPEWLFEMYPDAWLINEAGQRRRGWPSPCFSNPGFRDRSAKYIKKFVAHYKDRPTVVAYQLDNEPTNSDRCYCHHCVRKFRRWIKDKFGDQAPHVPDPLPYRMPDRLWVEWRLFSEENIVNKIRWVAEQVHKWDKEHPVTTNIMASVAFSDRYSVIGHDTWGLAETLDEMGMDYYSGLDEKGRFVGHGIKDSAAYSLSRSQAKGERFYCLEISPTTLMREGSRSNEIEIRKVGDPRVLRLITWRPIAYGAKNVTYWVWKSQTPSIWGLVKPDGTFFSEYVDIVKEISSKLKKLYPIIAEAKPLYPSDVAILYSKTTLHAMFTKGMPSLPVQSMYGAFAALWENGIQTDFINVDRAVEGYLANYKACFAPCLFVAEKELVDAFKTFVKNGGHLFTDALSGSVNEKMEYSIIPCNGLDKLMLYRNHFSLLEEKPEFTMTKDYGSTKAGKSFSGLSYIEEVEPLQGAQVLAEFKNKQPAAVSAKMGKGETMHVGTDLARAYFLNKEPSIAKMIVDFAKMAGTKPFATVSNLKPEESRLLEVALLGNEKTQIAFLLNANANEIHPKINVTNMPEKAKIIDVLAEKNIGLTNFPKEFETSIEPFDVKVIVIKPGT